MDPDALAYLRKTCLYKPGHHKPLSERACCWSRPVRELLRNGYCFLPEQYSDNGYLFRGMRSGTRQAIADLVFGHANGDEEMVQVEQAMDVYFLTHEISDAVAASSLHENNSDDNSILVIRAGYFNRQVQAHNAAMLAIGDAGIVFRYPFVGRPIEMHDIEFIITKRTNDIKVTQDIQYKLITVAAHTRRGLEKKLKQKTEELGITSAHPVACDRFPR